MEARTYWHRQTPDRPLFPAMIWSRPENRAHAGKLLIVGGNLYGFSAPADAYAAALKAGIGTARAILPSALSKTVGRVFAAGEYAPSTPSGSFSVRALGELLPMAAWADGIVLAGDLGRNSETAILLEKFADKYHGQLTIAGEAAEYFMLSPQVLATRPDTLLVLDLRQLQKLSTGLKLPTAVTSDMDLIRLIDVLHEITSDTSLTLIVRHHGSFHAAHKGQVSTTNTSVTADWHPELAAYAATWWLQNPSKTFEAITTGLLKPA